MVRSVLALSLLGLGAVTALPTQQNEERQIFGIGDGGGSFQPGNGDVQPPCLSSGLPSGELQPCLVPGFSGGGLIPAHPKDKRFTLPPNYKTNTKEVIKAIELQLIQLQNKPNKSADDHAEIKALKAALRYLADITAISAPDGTSSTFTPGKREPGITLPPDYKSNTKQVIRDLERQLIALQNKRNKTPDDLADIKALKAALKYLAGIASISAPDGSESSFTPGKREPGFTLPPDYKSNTKQVIRDLERQLIALQNKRNKTADDYADIKALKAALKYLAGITSISAPEGSDSSFTFGKRAENGPVTLNSVGIYASECPDLKGAEKALQSLLSRGTPPTAADLRLIQKLEHFLAGCGSAAIFKLPRVRRDDDTNVPSAASSILQGGVSDFDIAGLQQAYLTLFQAAASGASTSTLPPFTVWLVLQDIADLLALHGVTVDRSLSLVAPSTGAAVVSPRQQTIGREACSLVIILALRAALAQLYASYGDPRKAPADIFLTEQTIVSALQLCGQTVNGWTTLTPGSPIPGGAITPDPTVPGGSIVPDPTVPGGSITPDPYKGGGSLNPDPTKPGGGLNPSNRRAEQETAQDDPASLLAALHILEESYGTYGGDKEIPLSILPTMLNLVTVLQGWVPSVSVEGWPSLGPATVVIYPSP